MSFLAIAIASYPFHPIPPREEPGGAIAGEDVRASDRSCNRQQIAHFIYHAHFDYLPASATLD
jgi:hypothetical protein